MPKKYQEEYEKLIEKYQKNIEALKRASDFFRSDASKKEKIEKKPKLFDLLEKTEQIQKRLWEILIDESIGG